MIAIQFVCCLLLHSSTAAAAAAAGAVNRVKVLKSGACAGGFPVGVQ